MAIKDQHNNSKVLKKAKANLRQIGKGYAGTGVTLLDLVFSKIPHNGWLTCSDIRNRVQSEEMPKDITIPESSVSSSLSKLKDEGSVIARKMGHDLYHYKRVNKVSRKNGKGKLKYNATKLEPPITTHTSLTTADPYLAIEHSLEVIDAAMAAIKQERNKFIELRKIATSLVSESR